MTEYERNPEPGKYIPRTWRPLVTREHQPRFAEFVCPNCHPIMVDVKDITVVGIVTKPIDCPICGFNDPTPYLSEWSGFIVQCDLIVEGYLKLENPEKSKVF